MAFLHHEFEQPISAYVRAEFLYDMDEQHKGQLVNCTLFGLSSFKGEVPTFRTLLTDKENKEGPLEGSVYDYIPPHAIVIAKKETKEVELELNDLVYHNCMDYEFAVHSVSFLKKRREKEMDVQCYFRKRDLWLSGEYLLSMEWHRMNDLLHLIVLENGQVCFLPSHKIKFQNGSKAFPSFKKSYRTWKVS